jgi:hypothetical protein
MRYEIANRTGHNRARRSIRALKHLATPKAYLLSLTTQFRQIGGAIDEACKSN